MNDYRKQAENLGQKILGNRILITRNSTLRFKNASWSYFALETTYLFPPKKLKSSAPILEKADCSRLQWMILMLIYECGTKKSPRVNQSLYCKLIDGAS